MPINILSQYTSSNFSIKQIKHIKNKRRQLLSTVSLISLSACGGGGGNSSAPAPSTPQAPATPDFNESPTNTFTARDDNNRTLSEGSSSSNLTVTGRNGNDNITTGSGNDVVDGGAGNDVINSGAGDDVILGGAGADVITSGAGDDVIVVIGTTGASDYTDSAITDPASSGIDLSSLLSLSDINSHSTSDIVTGDSIDGGDGSDMLVIYGAVDLSGITIQNITTLQVNSTVTLTSDQLQQFTTVNGDGSSVINIVNEGDDTLVLDLSTIDISNIANLTTSGNVEIKISSADDLAGIEAITGITNLTIVLVDDGTGINSVNSSDLAAVVSGVAAIEIEDTVTLVIDDTISIAYMGIDELGGFGTIVISNAVARSRSILDGIIVDEDGSFESESGSDITVEEYGGDRIADIEPSDTGVLPEISIVDITVNEVEEQATFSVSLNARYYEEVIVDYVLNDGEAITLTFAVGETEKTVSATTWTDDITKGDNQTQTITLANPRNASITEDTATLTILDDDLGEPDGIVEISNTMDAAKTITLDDVIDASIGYEGDQDWFAIELTAGETYSIHVEHNYTADFDWHLGTITPYIYPIYSSDGTAIETYAGGFGFGGEPSDLTIQLANFIAPETGTYYFAVEHNGQSAEGDYHMWIETIDTSEPDGSADVGGDTASATSLANGEEIEGTLHSAIDLDYYATNLEADTIYEIKVTTPINSQGHHDWIAFDIFDAEGTQILGWWDAYYTSDGFTLYFTPESTGVYYTRISLADHLEPIDYSVSLQQVDVVPDPEITISDVSVSEELENATFTVNLSRNSDEEITVDYTTPDGTDGTLTFAAGETTQTFTTTWTDDSTDENDEVVTATLSNPTNATIADSSGSLTISDDDDAPTISIDDITANETDETDTFTVTLSTASGKEITVDYSAPDGTTGTLTFAAGETSKTFTTAWTDDSTDEDNEVVTATLSNATNATISDASGDLTIADDDAAPTISINDITANEVDETDTFTVSLSAASGKEITVDYSAPDGTTGALTFAAGETTQTFTTTWTDDSTDEADEVVTGTLSNPTNATIADSSGSLTISDDDAAPTVSVTDLTVNEADGTADFMVSLDAASGQEIKVDYSLNDGTLVTLTFAPGETSKTVTAASWTDDSTDEAVGDTAQTLVISNPVNATLGTNSATLTIADDDAAPAISIDDITANEADETDTFTVTLSSASVKTVTVDYSLNYPPFLTTLTFAPGETSKTITIVWNDDDIYQADNTQTFTLTNATNATISDSSGILTITNDDPEPTVSIVDIISTRANGAATFIVLLSNPSHFTVTVDYLAPDGTTGTLTFGPTETSQTFTTYWDVNGGDGSDEIAIATLSNATNTTITDNNGTLTIQDNGAPADSIYLASLDSNRGVTIIGSDQTGYAVANAGDVNGDGFEDILISAPYYDANGNYSVGVTYVVYGSENLPSTIDLSSLDGSNGFEMIGIDENDFSGRSLASAGDVNGDGYDDIIISAYYADPNENSLAGESYIVFGSAAQNASMNLSSLDGTNGFIIEGLYAGDQSGHSVSSAGDINGDGYDDIIIGAYRADPDGISSAGETYVVFGDSSFSSSVDVSSLDGTNGFSIKGVSIADYSGFSVSNAGDVNGDGYEDLIIGAYQPNGNGAAYVVFGNATYSSSIDLSALDGTNGFTISGSDIYDRLGFSVSGAGDVNGDGYDDVIVGAPYADPDGDEAGEAYVIFGSANPSASISVSTLNGSNGFAVTGEGNPSYTGISVSNLGDINGDGYDDVIVGARAADSDGVSFSGESYVIYGGDNFTATIAASSLDGIIGFTIKGSEVNDQVGWSVSGNGDVNGDGYDDLLVGAPYAGTGGEGYIIYGTATSNSVIMGTTSADTITGSTANERFIGREGNDIITTGTGDDVLVFDGTWGDDTVTDFEDSVDLLDLRDSDLTFSDLTITQSGSDTLIEDGSGNSIILTSITSTDITVDDFIF